MTTASGDGSCDTAPTKSPKLSSSRNVIRFPRPLTSIQGAVGNVAYDGQKPGARRSACECVKCPEGPYECILHGIFGIFSALQDPVSQIERRIPVLDDELFEARPGDHALGSPDDLLHRIG